MTSATDVKAIKLFQFWDKAEPPKEVVSVMKTWRNHKGLRVHLFDEKKAVRFIRNRMDKKYLRAFKLCAIPAMKADFFRYCALLNHGGIYVDADISLRKDKWPELKKLLSASEDGVIMRRERAIANDFIYIKKAGHPIIQKTLDQAVKNIQKRKSNNVWEVTGPGIMTGFYKKNAELFDPFSIESFKLLREIVEFQWKMNYKEGEGHWTNAQEKRSIFKTSKSEKNE